MRRRSRERHRQLLTQRQSIQVHERQRTERPQYYPFIFVHASSESSTHLDVRHLVRDHRPVDAREDQKNKGGVERGDHDGEKYPRSRDRDEHQDQREQETPNVHRPQTHVYLDVAHREPIHRRQVSLERVLRRAFVVLIILVVSAPAGLHGISHPVHDVIHLAL